MNLMKLPSKIEVPEVVSEFPWPRAVAAGSLVASAWLLISGKRKAALAVAAAGAVAAVFEHPETAREIWENVPDYLRKGQDFLVRAEDFVEDIAKKGEKFRETVMRQM